MKLGFDLDEVVVNLAVKFEEYLLETYGVTWPPECFSAYWFESCNFTDDAELNKKIITDMVHMANDPDFQYSSEPVPGAIEALRKLSRQGHSIHFITNRPKENVTRTAEWLRRHKLKFSSLHCLGQRGEKGMIGRSLNLDFFADDLEKHLESMWKYKNRFRKGLCLMTKPWNKDSIDGSRFTRVDNWEEILRHIGISNR